MNIEKIVKNDLKNLTEDRDALISHIENKDYKDIKELRFIIDSIDKETIVIDSLNSILLRANKESE